MKSPTSSSELKSALLSLRPYFLYAAGFSLIASLLVLAPSGYMLEVYERVVNSRNHYTLLWLTVVLLGALVLMEILEWARSEVMRTASYALDQQLHARVFNAIFRANTQRLPGGSTQALGDLRKICEFLYSPALLSIMEAPIAFVMMVLLFLISPTLGWTAVVFGILQVAVTFWNERTTKPPLVEANKAANTAQQQAESTLQNVEVIEAMGMLRNTHLRWMQKQREFLEFQTTASKSAGGFQALSKLLQTVLSSTLLGLSCWLMLHNELNGGAGMMVISSILGGRMLAPLVQVVSQWQTVINVRDSWQRLDGLLKRVPAQEQGMALPAPQGRLQVEPLVAGAPGNDNKILRGVGFELNRGDVLAIAGPSASGKTTLARLLVGLWPASMGKVRLDGVDIYQWNKSELGPHVGYLPQGVELFEGSIAENISRFGQVDMRKVQAAAEAVGLHDLIMSFPSGYETIVGPRGTRLSGGQRQRIGLARAFYDSPAYVVLDEPNSNLDEEGDKALSKAISQASSQGTTVIVITHRTNLLNVVSKMLILRDGQMQAFGPRDEVLSALNKASAKQPMKAPSASTASTKALQA